MPNMYRTIDSISQTSRLAKVPSWVLRDFPPRGFLSTAAEMVAWARGLLDNRRERVQGSGLELAVCSEILNPEP